MVPRTVPLLTSEECEFRKNKGTYNYLSKIHTEIQNVYAENQFRYD